MKHLEAIEIPWNINILCPRSGTFNWQSLANEIWKHRFWKLIADLCGSTSEEFDYKEEEGGKKDTMSVYYFSLRPATASCADDWQSF